jgi:hypothetical protein
MLTIRARGRFARSLAAGAVTAIAATTLTIATQAPASAGSCPSKCYAATVTPKDYIAGATVEFTVKLANETLATADQTLGSANVTEPVGFTITGVRQPATGTATVVGNTIQLREIAIAPSTAKSYSFTAATPTAAGAYTWTFAAKQSNDFNGTGNDFTLDTATSSVKTTGGSSNSACGPTTVSCGTNFIRYNRASTVTTGFVTNATTWLVGTMSFPATPTTGGQFWSMSAPRTPGSFCPINGAPAPCKFEMDLDDIPAPYAGHPATLSLICDVTRCAPNKPLVLVKNDQGNTTLIPLCSLSPTALCYTDARDANNNRLITVNNFEPGDPKIAGIDLP